VVATTEAEIIPTLEELGIGLVPYTRWAGDSSPAKSMNNTTFDSSIFASRSPHLHRKRESQPRGH